MKLNMLSYNGNSYPLFYNGGQNQQTHLGSCAESDRSIQVVCELPIMHNLGNHACSERILMNMRQLNIMKFLTFFHLLSLFFCYVNTFSKNSFPLCFKIQIFLRCTSVVLPIQRLCTMLLTKMCCLGIVQDCY